MFNDRGYDLITTNIIAAEQTLKPQILIAIKDGEVDKSELQGLSITVNEPSIFFIVTMSLFFSTFTIFSRLNSIGL